MMEESNKNTTEQRELMAIGLCLILMGILNFLYPEQVHLPISFGMLVFGLYLLVAK